jgi:mRNA interferase HigB
MRVISYRKLREFIEEHPESHPPLDAWYTATEAADWANFAELRQSFRSADVYKDCTIALVVYKTHAVYVRSVLTHADYDKGKWKDDCSKTRP